MCVDEKVKYVSKEEVSEFLDKYPNWIEFSADNGDNNFQIKYELDLYDEIINYWHEKKYFRFKNLTLTFEK